MSTRDNEKYIFYMLKVEILLHTKTHTAHDVNVFLCKKKHFVEIK